MTLMTHAFKLTINVDETFTNHRRWKSGASNGTNL